MAKLYNPLECCYKLHLSMDELKSLFELVVYYHEELRKTEYNLNSLASYLVNSLQLRYKRVRFYIADPREKVYYGFLSKGMNEEFKRKFDSYPENPFEKKKYKISFDDVPTVITDKVTGTEETYLLCYQKIRNHFNTESALPPYVTDLGFGDLINHSLTIHIMAAQTTPLGAVSIDFGNNEDKFSYEECQFLDAFVGTIFGRIIAPLLVKYFKKEEFKTETPSSSIGQYFSDAQSGGAFDYSKYKMSQRFGIIYNGAINNHPLNKVFKIIDRVKDSAQSLFLNAPNGTGKKLIAKALHYNSIRKEKPWVEITCTELTDTLLQGELFGYAKKCGVSNVPEDGKRGLIEEADGGTLFIDEIGKASKNVRNSLLDVIENKKVRRIGDNKSTPVNIRIIFSASEELEKFEDELINRLGPRVILPELKERQCDIPVLISYFIGKTHKINPDIKLNVPIYINPRTLSKLLNYEWSGNVRELEKAVITALLNMESEEQIIQDDHFDLDIKNCTPTENFGRNPIQIYPWPGETEIFEHTDDVGEIYNEIAESDTEKIFDILQKKLSFKIAKDFFENLNKKDDLKEKVLSNLSKRRNKIMLWENLIIKYCCDGCDDWSKVFSKKEDCQSKYVNGNVKKEDSCERIKQNGKPYKTFYDWLPKTSVRRIG